MRKRSRVHPLAAVDFPLPRRRTVEFKVFTVFTADCSNKPNHTEISNQFVEHLGNVKPEEVTVRLTAHYTIGIMSYSQK